MSSVDLATLRHLYIDEQLSIRSIAATLHVDPRTDLVTVMPAPGPSMKIEVVLPGAFALIVAPFWTVSVALLPTVTAALPSAVVEARLMIALVPSTTVPPPNPSVRR